ncbi:MAG: S8 family serine peptidase [Candidatus Limimorpha sp.]
MSPYYIHQWGIQATNIDELWNADQNNNSERPVIAILDTGVDIEHTDLKDNIWTNPGETPDNNDNDNNGFNDDIHGWDFVNQTNEIHDFNMHGTHCAGIAAAVGDNYKGIVGANPMAYIMPVTVLQSNGQGSISTLIQGINYAKNNGADVISMSLGTYAYSIALEQALAQAYQNCVLVGAAGNDGVGIDKRCDRYSPGPMFPAAFTFVLGVEASQLVPDFSPFGCGYRACYSNFDCDGHSFSQFGEEQLYNYELMAPGSGIVSTIPNGKYKYLNGTSMAAPLVAGGVSALLHAKEYPSQEMLWGDLINTASNTGNVDFKACYDAGPAPAQLQFVTLELNDTLAGDADYRPDAGEIIEFYPTIRTTWGAADNISYWLEFDENEDNTTLEFLNDGQTIDFGHSLSAYAKSKAANPFRFKVNENVVDGRYINLVLKATCSNAQNTLSYPFTIQVENGVELKGMITEDLTLYPNVHYIVTDNLGIPEGVTLTIKPGTVIKFKDGTKLANAGHISAIGTPDSMITFTKTDLGSGWQGMSLHYDDTLSYCIISEISSGDIVSSSSTTQEYFHGEPLNIDGHLYQTFFYNKSALLNNTIITNNSFDYYLITFTINSNIVNNSIKWNYYLHRICNYGDEAFFNSKVSFEDFTNNIDKTHYNNNVLNNIAIAMNPDMHGMIVGNYYYHNLYANILNNFVNYYFTNETNQYFDLYTSSQSIWSTSLGEGCYLGSGRNDIIKSHIYDFDYPQSGTFGQINIDSIGRRPISEAHGIVWKVVVTPENSEVGYDAQDEFEQLPPLGIGRHKFEVYFNRAMDTLVTPFLSMGVRPPYTQCAISEDGSWNEAGDIYTAYLNLDASTVTDGLNRIYVANAKDPEHFEIPVENLRFNVQVAAAGSMSEGFEATAGIGKVDLSWTTDSTYFADHLGYNMYRYQKDSEGNYLDTLLINNELLTDTTFTDFNVVPGERYYYFYRDMRTNLTESDASKNVSTIPLTAQPGDANGSLNVDVTDIVTVVNYITGDNPQPFVFGAADVNGDGEIDILDIVCIINIINTSDKGGIVTGVNEPSATALYSIVDGILYVDTPVELAGIQVYFNAEDDAEFEVLPALKDFEQVLQRMDDGRYMFLSFSMVGMKIEAGKHAIMKISNAEVDDMTLSDTNGNSVLAVEQTNTGIEENGIYVMNRPYPNPFNGSITVPYVIGENNGNISFNIFNITGQQVETFNFGTQSRGEYSFEWQPANGIANGVYIINMVVNGVESQRCKVIYMK